MTFQTPVADWTAVASPAVSVPNLGHFLVTIMSMMCSLCSGLVTSACPVLTCKQTVFLGLALRNKVF